MTTLMISIIAIILTVAISLMSFSWLNVDASRSYRGSLDVVEAISTQIQEIANYREVNETLPPSLEFLEQSANLPDLEGAAWEYQPSFDSLYSSVLCLKATASEINVRAMTSALSKLPGRVSLRDGCSIEADPYSPGPGENVWIMVRL